MKKKKKTKKEKLKAKKEKLKAKKNLKNRNSIKNLQNSKSLRKRLSGDLKKIQSYSNQPISVFPN